MSPRRLSMQFLKENCSIPVPNSTRIKTQSQFLLSDCKVASPTSGGTTTDMNHALIGGTRNQTTSKLNQVENLYRESNFVYRKKSNVFLNL